MTVKAIYDIAVIGGGINGSGIAADASGRGLSVLLAEKGDLGQGTSSASSKLIHGGLRYLEHYEFRLVREALQEREVLLAKAPHIIWPLRFVLPHVPAMRSKAMLQLGLFIYDHLATRKAIPSSRRIDLSRDPSGAPLKREFSSAFSYWDCWVDDARLVVLNARAAAAKGATILTRADVRQALVRDGLWQLAIDTQAGRQTILARVLVNAAGPWAGQLGTRFALATEREMAGGSLRLVKGSHIVVARPWSGEHAYLLQSSDGRVVFALPFEERFTLIGTTDVPFVGDPGDAAITPDEERYLLDAANRFLKRGLASSDVVWRYAGVRPLYDDASENPSTVTRDYHLRLTVARHRPALLTVLGGKLTTYRRLAEAALERLAPHLPPHGPAWTRNSQLPGAALGPGGTEALLAGLARLAPQLDRAYLARLVRRYGSEAPDVLGDARAPTDLGFRIGAVLSEREVVHLRRHEWAASADDVLWRRTKAGLHLDAGERASASELIAGVL